MIDKSRRFRLPSVDELTRPQEAILDLPLDGQHLVIGGPGTGKSVVALLRAGRLARLGKKHHYLAYNRILIHYCKRLAGSAAVNAHPWITWFKGLWRGITGKAAPTLGQGWDLDWKQIEAALPTLPPRDYSREYIVIDEGQDMPESFFRVLVMLGFENFFVVADFNQVLYPARAVNRQQLTAALALAADQVHELTYNHRNSTPVAGLAAHFCRLIADPMSPAPDAPANRPAALPILFSVDPRVPTCDFASLCRRVVLMADRQPRWLIGVLCFSESSRNAWASELTSATAALNSRLSYGIPTVGVFDGDGNFEIGGIAVLTVQSCKGLEFDAVVIGDIHEYWDKLANWQLLYVAISRAIERVILTFDCTRPFPLEQRFPVDPQLLRRLP